MQACTVGVTNFFASGSTQSSTQDPPTIKIWTDAVLYVSSLRAAKTKPVKNSRLRTVITGLLLAFSLKMAYNLGKYIGVDDTVHMFDYKSDLNFIMWQVFDLLLCYIRAVHSALLGA